MSKRSESEGFKVFIESVEGGDEEEEERDNVTLWMLSKFA